MAGRCGNTELLGGRLLLQLVEIDAELLDCVVRRAALQGFCHLAEHRPDVLRRLARIGELLLQHDQIAHGDAGVRREIIELSADIERLFECSARKRTRSTAERTLHSRRSGK